MASPEEEIAPLIPEGDPLGLNDSPPQERVMTQEDFVIMGYRLHGDTRTDAEILAEHEIVIQQCAEEFSKSPLYRERAKKNPEFWRWFATGRVR